MFRLFLSLSSHSEIVSTLVFVVVVVAVCRTHPTVISKMLEPTELDTAMSPRPFRATITLVMRSGIEVPAASMVRPIISSVIQKVSPT